MLKIEASGLIADDWMAYGLLQLDAFRNYRRVFSVLLNDRSKNERPSGRQKWIGSNRDRARIDVVMCRRRPIWKDSEEEEEEDEVGI